MELQKANEEITSLAIKLGFKWDYNPIGLPYSDFKTYPILELISKWIREEKNIMISIYNNASGYLWNKADTKGGTDRGWSDYTGPNESGVWDKYEEALEDAILTSLNTLKDGTTISK